MPDVGGPSEITVIRRLLLVLMLAQAPTGWAQSAAEDDYYASMEKERLAELVRDAHAGNREEQFELGTLYQYSSDKKVRNLYEAARWYEQAAIQGHAEAQDYLGLFYSGGVGGLPASCAKSIEWYTKAARSGWYPSWSNLAWKLATCEDPMLRDGARALKILREPSYRIPESAGTLDNLAAAHAALGNFEEARTLQRAAIALIEYRAQPARVSSFRERLRLYEIGQIWRGASYADPENFR